jgi:hypothetical protein
MLNSVTVTSVVNPVNPEAVMLDGYGFAGPDVPVAGIVIAPELLKVIVDAETGLAVIT